MPRSHASRVALALAFRYGCHLAMIALSLLGERRLAPSVPDLLLDAIPLDRWVQLHNYWLWLLCYLPLAIALGFRQPRRFLHFLWLGGLVSLLRGLSVLLTGLGPADPTWAHGPVTPEDLWQSFWALANPLHALTSQAPHVSLTQDNFFSGHTSSTLLLALYCQKDPVLRPLAWLGHVLVVASLLVGHIHYSIDIVGGWAIAYAVFRLACDRWPLDPPSP